MRLIKGLHHTVQVLLAVWAMGIFPFGMQAQSGDRQSIKLQKQLEKQLAYSAGMFGKWKHLGKIRNDSVRIDTTNHVISIHLSPAFTHLPVRDTLLSSMRKQYAADAGEQFAGYTMQFYSRGTRAECFIPPLYAADTLCCSVNRAIAGRSPYPVVQREATFANGLSGRHVALWHSHGMYYEPTLDRWEWQRARLLQTVEDMFSFAFVIPLLAPMLENAGATVFIPRERDVQTREVIIDGNGCTGSSEVIIVHDTHRWKTAKGGFAPKDTLFDGENPFKTGSHYKIEASPASNARLIYLPDIPAKGDYALYLSWAQYADALEEVNCLVGYAGGTSRFRLNQRMGAGTWIYLGTYHFNKGKNFYEGRIEIIAKNSRKGTISADAVRLGGGMGNVARQTGSQVPARRLLDSPNQALADTAAQAGGKIWQLSGRPRYMEAARYYLQYAGMPDTLVYSLSGGTSDYRDDYMARGEWVNYLMRTPSDTAQGLGIPIDLAFAFHTDAGAVLNDSVIGTLAIYSAERNAGLFTDSTSKLKSRYLADIVQTQVVNDVQQLHTPTWTRRAMWDKQYSEAWRPNTPALLLELLSHQNMTDMRYGLNPQFRFDASRAIYKGILRYLKGSEATVQPLPPSHIAIERQGGKKIRITWKPVNDPLEPSATPEGYNLYLRKENSGFGNSIFTAQPSIELELDEWQTCYDFKVTALNSGGESFPSEILSAALLPDSIPTVLVVSAFTRTGAPALFTADSITAGIAWWNNQGVPNGIDYATTGFQYNYNRHSAWLDDDSQGWGASHAGMEGKGIRGNTFDFAATHGKAFRSAGCSFVSVSRAAFEERHFDASSFKIVDIIFGEERGTAPSGNSEQTQFRVFTPTMIDAIERYAKAGGNIIVSGAHIGTDAIENHDTEAVEFAGETLGYRWRTSHADNAGRLNVTTEAAGVLPAHIVYNAGYSPHFYTVEAPDAIEPHGDHPVRIYRYAATGTSAGVAFRGKRHKAVSLGFPLETIVDDTILMQLIKGFIVFFDDTGNSKGNIPADDNRTPQ